jgi:TctA family transporter
MVLALVLGDAAESAFRQSMLISQGDMTTIFYSNWLVGSITSLPGSRRYACGARGSRSRQDR